MILTILTITITTTVPSITTVRGTAIRTGIIITIPNARLVMFAEPTRPKP